MLRIAECMQKLAQAVYNTVNTGAFHGQLPSDLTIRWNKRLRSTAGRVRIDVATRDASGIEIELAPKLITSLPRLVDTLAHEMCHVAAWLLEGNVTPRHGAAFNKMAQRIERVCTSSDGSCSGGRSGMAHNPTAVALPLHTASGD